jgi:type IV pilus assembly protein PilX
MTRQRGVVLLLALVLSLLLGLLAASALRDALVETHMAGLWRDSFEALEQAEQALLAGAAQLQLSPPPACQACQPPPRPHDLQGNWQGTASGFFQVQNLGQSDRAAHLPEGQQATLFRVTAVSRQARSRHVLEAVYALSGEEARRLLWRQRLREP